MFRPLSFILFLCLLGCGDDVAPTNAAADILLAPDAGSSSNISDISTSLDIKEDANTPDGISVDDVAQIDTFTEQPIDDISIEDMADSPDVLGWEDIVEDIQEIEDTGFPTEDVKEDETDTEICIPLCGNKECGADGCGGFCGSCEGIDACIDGFCMVTCEFENQTYLEGEGFVASDGCSVCLCLSTGTVGCNDDDCIEKCAPNCPLEKVGDGNCDLSCWNESCSFDTSPQGIADCSCADLSMEEDCLGVCSQTPLTPLVGNGVCDDGSNGAHLNCEAFSFDGGDCDTTGSCPNGTVADCTGECWSSELVGLILGDGVCHESLECAQWNFDEGDCYQGPGCQEGYLPDCNQECWPWDLLGLLEGDGICHEFLECEAWDFDGGDCYQGPGCQPGTVEDCAGDCWPSDFVGLFFGDQICHDFLNCPLWDYDGGDCL